MSTTKENKKVTDFEVFVRKLPRGGHGLFFSPSTPSKKGKKDEIEDKKGGDTGPSFFSSFF
jgi:hypothetical protein